MINARTAAMAAAALLLAVAAFQFALAAGVPWGSAAYGGQEAAADGSLPPGLRVASAFAVLFMGLSAWIVLVRGGVVAAGRLNERLIVGATWALVGLMVLNALANATSTSDVERWLMGSVTVALTILCTVVARRGRITHR
jgi:hypothetical protein